MKNFIAVIIIILLVVGWLWSNEQDQKSLTEAKQQIQQLSHTVSAWQQAGQTCSQAIEQAKKETQ